MTPSTLLAEDFADFLAEAQLGRKRRRKRGYRAKPFESDRERVEFPFALYETLTAPLTAGLNGPRRRRGGGRKLPD